MAAKVGYKRKELAAVEKQYKMIRDTIIGEAAVKNARELYLPRPDLGPVTDTTINRYRCYLQRAVFYNTVRPTMNGLVGQVFRKEVEVTAPNIMSYVIANASGDGVSLDQQARSTLALTLTLSRCGLFTDFPFAAGESVSIADISSGRVRPTITLYQPEQIINWRVTDIGSEEVLTLVVLLEAYISSDDGFEFKESPQLRVLRLTENGFNVEVYREKAEKSTYNMLKPPQGEMARVSTVIPVDASGKVFDRIPFAFVGSTNNSSQVDPPNFSDLASLNIAHYRNSADYEEACFVTGQPTVVMTGLTQEWVKDVLGGEVAFGSRGGIPLPVGADAKLIQAASNTMIKEAMDTKERQLVALGAKLIEQSKVQRTAFETKLESTAEASTLSTVTKNVESAYLVSLQFCAKYLGVDPNSIAVVMNTDFDLSTMTVEDRNQAIKEWQAGALTFSEMRTTLRRVGVATEDDAVAKATIDTDNAVDLLGGAE